jgi:hypothetical protein
MANTTTQFTIKINGTDQIVQLNDLLGQTSNSLGELKDQQQALSQAFEQADYGTAEFDALQSELRNVNTQLKVIDESVSDLTLGEKFEGVGRIVGAVGGAFAFASVSVQAFGDENGRTAQELQKLETQISAIIQGQQALTGIIEAFGSKNKIVAATLNTLSKGFNAVGISAKGAGLAVRGALIATGIGILVAGVSFLIANFDEIKAAGAGIFKAWQPFFDAVRNFASLITFGLIDNATTARITDTFDEIANKSKKILEDSNKKIEDLQKQATLGFESTLSNLNDQLEISSQAITDTIDLQFKSLDALFLSIKKNTTDPTASTFIGALAGQFRGLIQIIQGTNLTIEEQIISYEQSLESLRKLVEQNNLLGLSDEDRAKVLEGIIGLEKSLNEQLNSRIKILDDIAKKQFDIDRRDREAAKARADFRKLDLQDFKLLVDRLNTTIQLTDPKRFTSNGIRVLVDDLRNLRENIQDKNLRDFFSDKFLNEIIKTQGQNLFDKTKDGLKFLEVYRKELVKERKAEIDDAKLREKNEKALLEQRLKNAKLIYPEKEAELQLDFDTQVAINAQNRQIELTKIEDAYRSINVEITNIEREIIKTNAQTDIFRRTLNFDKAIESINRYKDDVALTEDELNNLRKIFPEINTEQKFTELSLTAQNDLLTKVANKQKVVIEQRLQQLTQTTTLTKEENDLLKATQAELDKINEGIATRNQLSQETKKNLQEELVLLKEQTEITKLQAAAQRPAQNQKQFEDQIGSIIELGRRQENIINDNFAKETKGLKETDDKYKIAILKRDTLLKEVNGNTIKQLDDAREAFFKLIIDSVSSIQSSITQVSDALFQAQTDAIDRQINANQILIDNFTEQITVLQEQISFIDEIINQRKATIDELQQAAESSTGGQREEILKQLDAEVKGTKNLVKEKKALQKQEEDAVKKQQALEKQNQKLALQSIVIQQQQAVAAQVLAIAQTGVAIASIAASSARQDFTFGFATVASIIAVTAALTANIIGINNALENLNQAEANLAAAGGASGGYPDGFEPMAKGGYTPRTGYGVDKTGEDNVGNYRLHANEYVVPRWMVESAKYGSMVNEMETARKRGFAEGGSPVPLRNTTPNNEQLTGLLVANLNKPIYVAVTDINDGQSRVNVIENRARF